MTFVIDPLWTTIAGAIAVYAGTKLKGNVNFKNRWIPIVTLVITALGQFVAAATASAGFFESIVKGVTWANALLVWLGTTGIVSVHKNTVMGKTGDGK
ncbi:MAG: hypothetical protein ACRDGA_02670 [Bacteroidota bacterium]